MAWPIRSKFHTLAVFLNTLVLLHFIIEAACLTKKVKIPFNNSTCPSPLSSTFAPYRGGGVGDSKRVHNVPSVHPFTTSVYRKHSSAVSSTVPKSVCVYDGICRSTGVYVYISASSTSINWSLGTKLRGGRIMVQNCGEGV